jgi:3-oxoacyl-[acyl-carrier protein] reductase
MAALPGMRANQWGRIVAITSLGVRQPYPNLALSNTARAGATGFLRTLAREVAGDGVTVNSVQPGVHATDRVRRVYGEGEELAEVLGTVPAGRLGDPRDLGAVVAFLCSVHASYLTGAAIPVDGGAYQALL